MRSLLLLICLLTTTAFSVSAQITVTNTTFFNVGDTLRFAQDNEPQSVSPGNSGEDQVWDFSGLGVDTTLRIPVLPASAGSAFASFPSAQMVLYMGFGEAYFERTSTEMLLLGFVGGGFGPIPVSITPKYVPPVVERRAPMNFFDVNTTQNSFLVAFSTEAIPDSLFTGFPFKPDSVRINQTIDRLDVVDGWGKANIPGGTYDVLRERRRTITETTVEVQVFGAWIDLATFGIPIPGIGKDTTLEFQFISDILKEPVVTLDVNPDNQNEVYQAQYRDNGVSSIHQHVSLSAVLLQGPVPAKDILWFDFTPLQQTVQLEIFSVQGHRLLWQDGLQGIWSQDITSLPQGLHVYRVMMAGQAVESGTFLIQR